VPAGFATPLLSGAAPFVDESAAEASFKRLAREAVVGEAVAEAAAMLDVIESGAVDLRRAICSACALDAQAVSDLLAPLAARQALAELLLRYALAPAFRSAAEQYAAALTDAPWGRNVCPVCASPPLLAELRGGESRRVLRCGRCGAAWDFQVLRCAFCDTRDHRQLMFFHAPGEAEFLRIDACESCRGYIKTMARLDPIRFELLPIEDLATARLDLLAQDHGYRRP
jgi:FdhE protein